MAPDGDHRAKGLFRNGCIRYEAPFLSHHAARVKRASVDSTDPNDHICDFLSISFQTPYSHSYHSRHLCDELDNTTSLLDLLLGLGADVAGTNDDGNGRETALSKDLGVAEGEDVENGGLVGLLGEVLIALLGRDERPELVEVDDGLPELVMELVD